MTYIAVRISGKPADEEHHYGHGKVESVSALGETALLFLLSGIVIWEAVKRLIEHEPHIVVATPGRLQDHLENTKGFSLRSCRYLVSLSPHTLSCFAVELSLTHEIDTGHGRS